MKIKSSAFVAAKGFSFWQHLKNGALFFFISFFLICLQVSGLQDAQVFE
jgi:hypothetical protein